MAAIDFLGEKKLSAAEASPDPQNLMTAEKITALLSDMLGRNKCRPSPGLLTLFAQIPLILGEYRSNRHHISSRLLLFTTAEIGLGEEYDDAEKASLKALQALCHWEWSGYSAAREEYFREAGQPVGTRVPTFTPNVARLFKQAISSRSQSTDWDRILTVADLLMAFPPPGSRSEALLDQFGIGASRFHEAMRRAVASAKPSEMGTPPSNGPDLNDWVDMHRDEPADNDELGRLGFAQVLADRIREDYKASQLRQAAAADKTAQSKDGASAFMVHLHGPWGTGKSSILNFLEDQLRPPRGDWIIVTFNAWRDQRMQPPWWTLITAIHTTARQQLSWGRSLRLRLRWLGWRMRADYLPVIAVAACILGLAMLVFWVGNPSGAVDALPTGNVGAADSQEQFANWLDRLLKLIVAAITVIGGIIIWSRSLGMGSQRAAQAYADIKNDPYRPIARLFDRLVAAIDRPIAVFIDDLDRCDCKYVVELLEGIQTLMRRAPVTYVIAADRKWICSSFEQRYKGFTPPIGEPGRPLGYLFLDKLFQVSAAIPQLADEQRSAYWRGLLKDKARDPEATGSGGNEESGSEINADPIDPEEAFDRATDAVSSLNTQEQLRKYVDAIETTGDPIRIQAARAAAARRIASPKVASDFEHRLRRFSGLIEPNPRAMKRLVNAYGIHQAALLLAGRNVGAGALARWTILELRWPLLADFLAQRPGCVDLIAEKLEGDELPEVPLELRPLFGDEFVTNVVALGADNGLTSRAIRDILGAAHRER